MKQMIAEFAIFANSFVGEYLKINLNSNKSFEEYRNSLKNNKIPKT